MNTVTSTIATTPRTAPPWAVRMRRINDWLLHDALGGPRPLKFSWIINFQKGGTFVFLGLLMWFYSGRTPAEILSAEPDFIDRSGLAENLSMLRVNGMHATAKQIKKYAQAFQNSTA